MTPIRRLSLLVGLAVTACGPDPPEPGHARPIAVLSAFPAELAPLVEAASVDEIVTLGERPFRVGRLAGHPVVLGLTGIGMVNAERTTRAVIEHFDPTGIVVSGVSGTARRIGDVDVPETWSLREGTGTWSVDPAWLDVARQLEAPDGLALEHCTQVASGPSDERVCLEHRPSVAVGGEGRSGDPFGGEALPCTADGDEVSGCDVDSTRRPALDPREIEPMGDGPDGTVDMETAAIGREAHTRGVPYIAFRAASDGAGDPLGLPGFPAQFYAYYRLAAGNAAAATVAFLERLGTGP